MINLPEIFAPYAQHWFSPIAKYIIKPKNGGTGMHYFTRDLISTLLTFMSAPYNFRLDKEDPEMKLLATKVINQLIT